MLITEMGAVPRPGDLWSGHPFAPTENHRDDYGDSVFFAIQPDPGAAVSLRDLAWDFCDRYELRTAPLKKSCLHSTLLGIGDYEKLSSEFFDGLRTAAAAVAMSPFAVGFDWAERFSGRREPALVLTGDDNVTGLLGLHEALSTTLREAGFLTRQQRYRPHVTLAYAKHQIREQPIDEIRWTVREFVLIHSFQGHGRHELLGRWPLRG